jgi:hypothetical protein
LPDFAFRNLKAMAFARQSGKKIHFAVACPACRSLIAPQTGCRAGAWRARAPHAMRPPNHSTVKLRGQNARFVLFIDTAKEPD